MRIFRPPALALLGACVAACVAGPAVANSFSYEHALVTRHFEPDEPELEGRSHIIVFGVEDADGSGGWKLRAGLETGEEETENEEAEGEPPVSILSVDIARIFEISSIDDFVSATLGVRYLEYDYFALREQRFLGGSIGVTLAFPIVGDRLVGFGGLGYDLLASLDELELRGLHGEAGLASRVVGNLHVRAGARFRRYEVTAEDDLALSDDRMTAVFAGIQMRW